MRVRAAHARFQPRRLAQCVGRRGAGRIRLPMGRRRPLPSRTPRPAVARPVRRASGFQLPVRPVALVPRARRAVLGRLEPRGVSAERGARFAARPARAHAALRGTRARRRYRRAAEDPAPGRAPSRACATPAGVRSTSTMAPTRSTRAHHAAIARAKRYGHAALLQREALLRQRLAEYAPPLGALRMPHAGGALEIGG